MAPCYRVELLEDRVRAHVENITKWQLEPKILNACGRGITLQIPRTNKKAMPSIKWSKVAYIKLHETDWKLSIVRFKLTSGASIRFRTTHEAAFELLDGIADFVRLYEEKWRLFEQDPDRTVVRKLHIVPSGAKELVIKVVTPDGAIKTRYDSEELEDLIYY